MTKTVFILGAGASKGAGIPLMQEFLDTAYDFFKSGEIEPNDEDFKMVFDAIRELQLVNAKSRIDLINLESVFAAFEMAQTINKFSDYSKQKIIKLNKAMKQVIQKTIETTMTIPVKDRQLGYPFPYDRFADMIYNLQNNVNPPHDISIITFNYDLALDFTLYKMGININYWLEPNAKGDIPLLKLHGSMNWARCKKCRKVIPLKLDEYYLNRHPLLGKTTTQYRIKITSHLNNLQHCNQPVAPEPFIVPPTWNKSNYYSALKPIWAKAALVLNEAENIFIIGYSLPKSDSFFRYLFALGTMGKALLRKIWVFNPENSGKTKQRYLDLLGQTAIDRFEYKSYSFEEAIPDILHSFVK